MAYESDRAKDLGGEPSLSEMTRKAIEILAKNTKGFFLWWDPAVSIMHTMRVLLIEL